MELQSQLHLKIDDIQRKLRECNFECNRLKEMIDKSLLAPSWAKAGPSPLPETVAPVTPPVDESAFPKTQILPPPLPLTPEPVHANPVVKSMDSPVQSPVSTIAAHVPVKTPPPPASRPGRGNQNLEDFIGGNLLNKIGIGILIIGIGIFVKYAIDKDWIGPMGRVMVGVLCSAILLGVAHYLRQTYKAFSSVLLGGGLAVLYFSVAIAFHQYALITQTAAFALMCGVTAAAVFFSVAYNRQEIAIIGTLGGFATPFMLMNGQGNYIALFSYLIILNMGMLVLSAVRNWQAVRVVSFAATLLIYLGWLVKNLGWETDPALGGTLAFGIALFTLFFAMNLVFFARAKKALGTLEYSLLLLNSAFFFGTGMAILSQTAGGIYMGLYTALMGAFHFAFIFPVRKLIKVDNNIQVMLIGLVLTFLTLAVPIQLEGRYLTMFWSLEAALVLYLGQRFGHNLLKTGSKLISLLAIGAILIDWTTFYFVDTLQPDRTLFLNGAFVTGLVASAGLLIQHLLYLREGAKDGFSAFAAKIAQYAFIPLAYLVFALELGAHFGMQSASASWTAVLTFSFIYLSALHVWSRVGKHNALALATAVLTVVGVIFYCAFHFGFLHTLPVNKDISLSWQFLIEPGMFLAYALSSVALYRAIGWGGTAGRAWVWASAAVGILLCSLALDNAMALAGVDLHQVHRAGYPILWGLIGAGMVVAGLRMRVLALRAGGLILFLLILVKLFAFDIRMASTGGKIAAFICLGVLLLVVSFLYQKLKVLLTDEAATDKEESGLPNP